MSSPNVASPRLSGESMRNTTAAIIILTVGLKARSKSGHKSQDLLLKGMLILNWH